MKTGIQRSLCVAAACLLTCVMTECVVRTTHLFGAAIPWSEPDPVLRWRFVPGRPYWFIKENDHPVTGRINQYGWRDREWSLEKPPGLIRIAVLGDSFVEAFQVELSRTFLALAEARLQERLGRKVEVMNFGRSDATQTEELLILRQEVLRFSPDLVVVCFFPGNDIRDVSPDTALNPIRPFYWVGADGSLVLDTSFKETREFRLKRFLHAVKRHSAVVSLLSERLTALPLARRLAVRNVANPSVSEIPEGYLTLATAIQDPVYARNYQLNKQLLRTMADDCRARGIRFMLVCVNTPAYIPNIAAGYQALDPAFDPTFFDDDLARFAAEIQVEYLGLQRVFQRRFQERGVPLHWGHWNYEGHQVVAEVLSETLLPILQGGAPSVTHQ